MLRRGFSCLKPGPTHIPQLPRRDTRAQKVKSVVEKSKVNDKISDTKKTPSAQKVIVYDYAFAKSGKEYYCRLFFRYMLPKN